MVLYPIEWSKRVNKPNHLQYVKNIPTQERDAIFIDAINKGDIIVDTAQGRAFRKNGKEYLSLSKGRVCVLYRNKDGYHSCSRARLIWLAYHGKIPENHFIYNKNRLLTDDSISNLYSDSNRENLRAGRARIPNTTYAILSGKDVQEIRYLMLERNLSGRYVAELYKTSKPNIFCIKASRSWRSLPIDYSEIDKVALDALTDPYKRNTLPRVRKKTVIFKSPKEPKLLVRVEDKEKYDDLSKALPKTVNTIKRIVYSSAYLTNPAEQRRKYIQVIKNINKGKSINRENLQFLFSYLENVNKYERAMQKYQELLNPNPQHKDAANV
jgi:hypothetical protein